jgi:hypothetical protein
LIALILFLFELVVQCVYQKDYIFGFYFWLDLIASISLLPDIGWVWNAIVSSSATTGGTDSAATLKAGRASRAGAKAGRIVRIVRLVRLVRIVKLYKLAAGVDDAELNEAIKREPTKVGKKLTELTTRRLIILVLLMLIVLPFLDGTLLADDVDTFQVNMLNELHVMPQSMNVTGCGIGHCITPGLFRDVVEVFFFSSKSLFINLSCFVNIVRRMQGMLGSYFFLRFAKKIVAPFGLPMSQIVGLRALNLLLWTTTTMSLLWIQIQKMAGMPKRG